MWLWTSTNGDRLGSNIDWSDHEYAAIGRKAEEIAAVGISIFEGMRNGERVYVEPEVICLEEAQDTFWEASSSLKQEIILAVLCPCMHVFQPSHLTSAVEWCMMHWLIPRSPTQPGWKRLPNLATIQGWNRSTRMYLSLCWHISSSSNPVLTDLGQVFTEFPGHLAGTGLVFSGPPLPWF